MKRLKIYIASPYTPEHVNAHDFARVAHQNTLNAIRAGIAIIEKGHIPFIPHLTHYIHLETKNPLPRKFYYDYDQVWLKCCDGLLYLASSKGSDRELQLAKKLGLRIFRSVEEIPFR